MAEITGGEMLEIRPPWRPNPWQDHLGWPDQARRYWSRIGECDALARLDFAPPCPAPGAEPEDHQSERDGEEEPWAQWGGCGRAQGAVKALCLLRVETGRRIDHERTRDAENGPAC